jgi:hypothetical protein
VLGAAGVVVGGVVVVPVPLVGGVVVVPLPAVVPPVLGPGWVVVVTDVVTGTTVHQ